MPFPGFNDLGAFTPTQQQQLQQFAAYLQGYLQTQHKDGGEHGAITADSIVTTGDGDFGGDVTVDGNVIAQNGENTEVEIGFMSSSPHGYSDEGGIEFGSSSGRRWSWIANSVIGTHFCNLYDLGGSLGNEAIGVEVSGTTYYFAPGTGATGILGSNSVPVRKWTGYLSQLFLGTNAVAAGEWQAVAYAAGNFTASAGTWTVDAGDQLEYTYVIVGKTLTVRYSINATDVSNAGVTLKIAIPGGFTSAARVQFGLGVAADNGGARAVALVEVPSGGTVINLYATLAAGGFAITAADNTAVFGTITFEVQ